MRVTTTIFMLETPRKIVEPRGVAFLQAYNPVADVGTDIGLRIFVSLYSGRSRIENMGSSADEGA